MVLKNPKISVVVPTYNVELYLEKCLNSVKKQTFTDFEVLIVNDESTDSSLTIAREFAKVDKRFSVISQKNKGLGGARNTGIMNAKGDFLFLLDSDDYIKENTFEELYHYAMDNDLDIIVFNYDKVDENDKKLASPKFGEGVFSKEEAFGKILSLKTSPQAWNKFYKRNLFLDNSISYPEKFLHEDLPVTYKLFWNAEKVGYLNKSYYYWLVRGGSITQSFTYKHINDIVKALVETKEFLIENKLLKDYEYEYVRGSVQMLNILIERSILFSIKTPAFQEYVKYIIDSSSIVDRDQVEKLSDYDKKLYSKFNNNYKKISETKALDSNDIYLQKINVLENQLSDVYSSKAYQLAKLYHFKRDMLLPIGSKRRKILSKILNRK